MLETHLAANEEANLCVPLRRTSENVVQRKSNFGEYIFYAIRYIGSR